MSQGSGLVCTTCGATSSAFTRGGGHGDLVCGICGTVVTGSRAVETEFDDVAVSRTKRDVRYSGKADELSQQSFSLSQRLVASQSQQREFFGTPTPSSLGATGGTGAGAGNASQRRFSQFSQPSLGESFADSLLPGDGSTAFDGPGALDERDLLWFSPFSSIFGEASSSKGRCVPTLHVLFDGEASDGAAAVVADCPLREGSLERPAPGQSRSKAQSDSHSQQDSNSSSSRYAGWNNGHQDDDDDVDLGDIGDEATEQRADFLDTVIQEVLGINPSRGGDQLRLIAETTPLELLDEKAPNLSQEQRSTAGLLKKGPHMLDALQQTLVRQVEGLMNFTGAIEGLRGTALLLWQRFCTWYIQLKTRSVLTVSLLRLVQQEGIDVNTTAIASAGAFIGNIGKRAPIRKRRRRAVNATSGEDGESSSSDDDGTDGFVTDRGPTEDSDGGALRNSSGASLLNNPMPPPSTSKSSRRTRVHRSTIPMLAQQLSERMTASIRAEMQRQEISDSKVEAPLKDHSEQHDVLLLDLLETTEGVLKPIVTLGILVLALSSVNDAICVHEILRMVARDDIPYIAALVRMDWDPKHWSDQPQVPFSTDISEVVNSSVATTVPSPDELSQTVAGLALLFDLDLETPAMASARWFGTSLDSDPLTRSTWISRMSMVGMVERLLWNLELGNAVASVALQLASLFDQIQCEDTETGRLLQKMTVPHFFRAVKSARKRTSVNSLLGNQTQYFRSRISSSRDETCIPRAAAAAVVFMSMKIVYARSLAGLRVENSRSAAEPYWLAYFAKLGEDIESLSEAMLGLQNAVLGPAPTKMRHIAELDDYFTQVVHPLDVFSRPSGKKKPLREGVAILMDAVRKMTDNRFCREAHVDEDDEADFDEEESFPFRTSTDSARPLDNLPRGSCFYYEFPPTALAAPANQDERLVPKLPRPSRILLKLLADSVLVSQSVVHGTLCLLEREFLRPLL